MEGDVSGSKSVDADKESLATKAVVSSQSLAKSKAATSAKAGA